MSSKSSNPAISILLPTRGRTDQLKKSITSLLSLAHDPANIEWLLGFDNDDTDSIDYFEKNIAPLIDQSGGIFYCLGFDPVGYEKLNVYVNGLADQAAGEWFIFWNDDAVMLDQDWDRTIRNYTGQFRLLAFETHNRHPYSIFPIVPRKWLEIVGHLSGHQLNDAWLSQIAWMLDIMTRIDVHVEHDRFDLTGNNNDVTFQKRKVLEGNINDPRDFNYVSARNARLNEANKIAEYLRSQGADMAYWDNIKAGKQDPWEKMLANDPNKHMTRVA